MNKKILKNILVVIENLEYGGTMTQLIHMINNDIFKNNFFYIVTNKNNKAVIQLKRFSKNKNLKIIYFNPLNNIFFNNLILKLLYMFFRPFFFFLSIFQMILILKKIEFDLLLADCGGYGNFRSEMASLIASKLLGKKNLFILIHHCYTKPLFWNYILELINLFLGNILSGIIFVSHATKNSIKKNTKLLTFYKKKLIVIHNGIEVREYKKRNLKVLKKKKNTLSIGMLARIDRYKGQIDLLKGFKNLLIKERERFNLFFVGSGKVNEKKILNRAIKDYELEKYAKIVNYINEDNLIILKNFDLFFSLTKDFEGFGYSIAESLYSSVPVVSTKVGGVLEFLNNKNSILINPGDIRSITRVIRKFLYDRKFFNKKIILGKKTIEEKFNSNIMSKKYLEYFKLNLDNV